MGQEPGDVSELDSPSGSSFTFPRKSGEVLDPGLTGKAQTRGQQLLAPPPLCPAGWVRIPGVEAGQGAWAAGDKLRPAEGWLRVTGCLASSLELPLTPEPSSSGPEDPF